MDPVITLPTDLEKHSGSSVRVWYQRWIENGRDVRSLIPVKTARGNRTPRYGNRGKRLAIFESIIKNLYFRPDKRPHLSSIYDEYKVQCAEAGLSVESASSFYRRVTRTYTAREEYAGRWGRRAAYLKYGVFDLRKPPDFALSEVQVDHCLIDVFVRPPWGGKPVRPWLTVIIDVATRMVLGFHVGFHPPSYACLQRAVAHSIWPKDLSGFPEIVNEWPACGVFDLCLADNGLDLTGNSLRDTAAALDFEIMHLPVRAPWLKAIIERYFGTLNTRVFDLADGKAIYNEMEPFDPSRHATWTLDDLCYRIVKFIVDEYHTREHPGIGTTPLKRWAELSQLRAIRLPPSPDLIIGLTGEVHRAKISSTGVHIEGLTYQDHELFTRIRAERGARDRFWEFRRDPYDIGVIHLLHNGAWQHIPCTTPQAAVGVSRFQHRMHLKVARYMTGAGECVSEQTIVDARALVAAQVEDFQAGRSKSASPRQAARYSDKGTYATGIVGLTAKTPLAPSRSNEEQETVVGGSSPMVEEDLRPDEYMKDLMEEWRDG